MLAFEYKISFFFFFFLGTIYFSCVQDTCQMQRSSLDQDVDKEYPVPETLEGRGELLHMYKMVRDDFYGLRRKLEDYKVISFFFS